MQIHDGARPGERAHIKALKELLSHHRNSNDRHVWDSKELDRGDNQRL